MTEQAGSVTITWLEMTEPPSAPPAHPPMGPRLALLAAADAPVHWFLYLYSTVGAPWGWTDWLEAPRETLEAFLAPPEVTIHTLMVDGWPGGFFVLDARRAAADGTCDLAYFGLMPEAIGRGLGHWLLDTAIRAAWDLPGVARLTVNTCTLDHPRALGLYQKLGFVPVRRESRPLSG